MRFIGIYDYTIILTFASLFSSFYGMIQASQGNYNAAVACLLLCGICDAFDGTVARSKKDRTEDEKAYGIQLDSLCDVVSFGVFPAFLCYQLGMKSKLGLLILFAYCMCGLSRLAFFNVEEGKRQKTESGCNKTYRGLPITSISIILPIVYVLRVFIAEKLFRKVLHALMAVMAFLFVLDFSVRKYDFKKLLVKTKLMKD